MQLKDYLSNAKRKPLRFVRHADGSFASDSQVFHKHPESFTIFKNVLEHILNFLFTVLIGHCIM